MNEYLIPTLYTILATAALALGVRTLIADNFSGMLWASRKPFTCVYCLSFWLAIPVVLVVMPGMDVPTSIVMILATHIGAFIVTQRFI